MSEAFPPIYLDHHSTTPVDPRVLEALLPYLKEHFGNSSSNTHSFGWKAREAVEEARARVAKLIGASAREIIFTGGATESNNLALLGVLRHLPSNQKHHVISSTIEHQAVLEPLEVLEAGGVEVTRLRPDGEGSIHPEQVREALRPETRLVSLMAANNEIGTLAPLEEIGQLLVERGVPFHTDAAQAVGKMPIDVQAQGIGLLSLSGHKIYAPKGIGALYVRGRAPRVRLKAVVTGGGQERGLRPGTVNVPGVVALGKACELALEEREEETSRLAGLRDRLWKGLSSRLTGLTLNGPDWTESSTGRLAGNLNVSFSGVPGESLLTGLRDIAVSSGSACTSQVPEPSHVLRALGVSAQLAHASIRFGLGRFTTEEEIDRTVERISAHVEGLREITRSVRGGRR